MKAASKPSFAPSRPPKPSSPPSPAATSPPNTSPASANASPHAKPKPSPHAKRSRTAIEDLQGEAQRLDLTDWVHRTADLLERTADYRGELQQLREDLRNRFEAERELERARDRDTHARIAHDEACADRDGAHREADGAEAERAALEATAGADIRELETRLQGARKQAQDLDHRRDTLRTNIETALQKEAAASARRDGALTRRDENETARDAAIARLRRFVDEGLLAVARARDAENPEPAPGHDERLEELLPDPTADPASAAPWSATRGVEIARGIEKNLHRTL